MDNSPKKNKLHAFVFLSFLSRQTNQPDSTCLSMLHVFILLMHMHAGCHLLYVVNIACLISVVHSCASVEDGVSPEDDAASLSGAAAVSG